MINSPFLNTKPTGKYKERESSHWDKVTLPSSAINNLLHFFFKNEVRDRVVKIAFEEKNYPDYINGYVMYLYYYLQGKCYKGEPYPHSASHYYLEVKKF